MMDLSFLRGQMAGDEKLVARFVSIFKTQVPAQVSQLPGLCENEDWEELSSAFHSLKTQFNYMLMTEFAEQMREMEESVDNGETAFIATRIAEFTTKFNHFWQNEFPEN
ncbi:Hpt domain-containing protein [Dyadobacter psychrophilus]|uniref:Hpt domain-containing protein n=1 Tax=Dyadobacter psychrophilus TaxID=651661 RepID=A0A1T5DYR7_9BACT|nr:Hpt domain-containing protein [Dyadobacter psychrophilus]SKB76764.1 Hpt domain-containing protein [Dyadobacter psychrophilus]